MDCNTKKIGIDTWEVYQCQASEVAIKCPKMDY